MRAWRNAEAEIKYNEHDPNNKPSKYMRIMREVKKAAYGAYGGTVITVSVLQKILRKEL